MAYTDIPLAPQRIKDSQPLIRQNFIEISTLVDVDHYTFGSPTAGEHKKVTLPDQGLSPVFPGNDLGLFAKIPTANPLTIVNELFIRRQDGTETNISGKGINIGPSGTTWSYLPSGFLIKIGFSGGAGAGFQTIIYDVAPNIPVFQSVFFTFLQPVAGGFDPNEYPILLANGYLTTSFDVFNGARTAAGIPINCTFTYMTIGT